MLCTLGGDGADDIRAGAGRCRVRPVEYRYEPQPVVRGGGTRTDTAGGGQRSQIAVAAQPLDIELSVDLGQGHRDGAALHECRAQIFDAGAVAASPLNLER